MFVFTEAVHRYYESRRRIIRDSVPARKNVTIQNKKNAKSATTKSSKEVYFSMYIGNLGLILVVQQKRKSSCY